MNPIPEEIPRQQRGRTRQRRGRFTAIVLLLAVLSAAVLAAGTPEMDWWVIGGGGAQVDSGAYSLGGTLGQPVTGASSAGGYELCAGYWCGAAGRHTVYLPVVLRAHP
jgi:hypothetical protein